MGRVRGWVIDGTCQSTVSNYIHQPANRTYPDGSIDGCAKRSMITVDHNDPMLFRSAQGTQQITTCLRKPIFKTHQQQDSSSWPEECHGRQMRDPRRGRCNSIPYSYSLFYPFSWLFCGSSNQTHCVASKSDLPRMLVFFFFFVLIEQFPVQIMAAGPPRWISSVVLMSILQQESGRGWVEPR